MRVPAIHVSPRARIAVCILAYALPGFAIGCAPLVSTTVVPSSAYTRYRDRAIEVRTRNGRAIRFRANSYTVEHSDTLTITGKGKVYREKGIYVEKVFEGTIVGPDIEEILILRPWDPTDFAKLMFLFMIFVPLGYSGI